MDLIREFDMIAWTASSMVAFFLALLAHRRWWSGHINKTDKLVSDNVLSWILFIFLTGFGNMVGMINRLYFAEIYGIISFQYIFWKKVSITFDILAIAIKVYNIESTMRFLKKNYFTFINIFVIFFNWIIWEQGISSTSVLPLILLFFQTIGFFILPILYVVIAIKTSGTYRKDALKLLIGILLLEISLALQAQNLEIVFVGFTESFLLNFGFPFQLITPIIVTIGFWLVYNGITNLLDTI